MCPGHNRKLQLVLKHDMFRLVCVHTLRLSAASDEKTGSIVKFDGQNPQQCVVAPLLPAGDAMMISGVVLRCTCPAA